MKLRIFRDKSKKSSNFPVVVGFGILLIQGLLLLSQFMGSAHAADFGFRMRQDPPTNVYCGFISKVKRNFKTEGGIFISLVDVKSGTYSNEEGKVFFEPGSSVFETTLTPSLYSTAEQIERVRLIRKTLRRIRRAGEYLCVSFPISQSARETGFPYGLGFSPTREGAILQIEKNAQF